MRLYIVNCGKFDCIGVDLATTNVEKAAHFIAERVGTVDFFETFNDMECWEDEKKLYTYTSKTPVQQDILEEIRKIEAELVPTN